MACSHIQRLFNENLSLGVSVEVSGSVATLWLENTGQNILQLTRILFAVSYPGSGSIWYLRPPGQAIAWSYPSATLEQGLRGSFFTVGGLSAGAVLEAQVEYTEVQDRSRSCEFTV